MGVKEFLSRALKKDGRFKELEKEMRIQKMVEERLKPANERELERFYEEERQKQITQNLEEFRKAKQEQAWHPSETILNQKNIFKEKTTILQDNKKLLKNKSSMLHDKKLFKIGKSKAQKKGGLFFKK